MDFLCNLPAAQLLEKFGNRSCYVLQLRRISQLSQLHKNLTFPTAADAAYSQLHKNFPAGARERHNWKILEELEKFGI